MNSIQSRESGTTLIEVLVTLVIIAFGLLGLAGLQVRLQQTEFEAYQRTQALLLLADMADRIAVNRTAALTYVTTAASPLGAGMTCPTDVSTVQKADVAEWCNALQGAAEATSGGASVGVMTGGRGCIEELSTNQYMVTVAWQGTAPVSAPPAAVACGKDLYDGATGSACTADRCRRVVTTVVRVGNLL
jgi:type IV pilus assembly protein PilV